MISDLLPVERLALVIMQRELESRLVEQEKEKETKEQIRKIKENERKIREKLKPQEGKDLRF